MTEYLVEVQIPNSHKSLISEVTLSKETTDKYSLKGIAEVAAGVLFSNTGLSLWVPEEVIAIAAKSAKVIAIDGKKIHKK